MNAERRQLTAEQTDPQSLLGNINEVPQIAGKQLARPALEHGSILQIIEVNL